MDQHDNIGIDILERDGAVIVVVEGEVDLSAAATFEESLAEVSASPASAIVLDLDRVTFMDSAGLHVVLQFSVSEGNRRRVALTRGSDQVRRLLEVTGVGRYLKFVPSPELGGARRSIQRRGPDLASRLLKAVPDVTQGDQPSAEAVQLRDRDQVP